MTDWHNRKILRNMLKCLSCGDIIESKHLHDFVWCSCKNVFIDGGTSYVRYGGKMDGIQLLTVYAD